MNEQNEQNEQNNKNKTSENDGLLKSNYDPAQIGNAFAAQVGARAERKLRAQRSSSGIWFGLGMMGLVGWSVAVPTLLGTALGLWLDARHTDSHSWTLALLVAGLMLGCMNAWHWVANEDRAMHAEPEPEPPVASQRGGVPTEMEKRRD